MPATTIEGPEAARALGARLNGHDRRRPIVVVSSSAGTDTPWIDVDRLVDELGDLAEVHLIRTGPDTFALSDTLPPLTQVYGGAGRAYPLGHAWVSDVRRSPLRFAHDRRSGRDATDDLVADALSMVASTVRSSPPRPGLVPANGRVKGIIGGRAVVELDDRTHVSVVPELTVPGVAVERLLTPGMVVHGRADLLQKRLDLAASLRSPADLMAGVRPGDVVLTRVDDVTAVEVSLAVAPTLVVVVHRDLVTGNDRDDLRSLFTVGEVVPAHVLDAAVEIFSLSLLDVDDDALPLEAPSLLAGGPAWLLPPDEEPPPTPAPVAPAPPPDPEPSPEPSPEPDPEPEPDHPATPRGPSPLMFDPKRRDVRPVSPPTTPTGVEPLRPTAPVPTAPPSVLAKQQSLTIETLKREAKARDDLLLAMTSERDALGEQLTEANAEIARLRGELKRLRTENRKRTQHQRRPGRLFVDDADQFRHDLQVAWAERIPAPDKAERPLCRVDLAPDFVASVDALEGISRSKVLDVVVEVATGLALQLPGRELHRLRRGSGGGDPYLERPDGAKAMRCALQVGTPGARRLHYWQRLDGSVELVKVAVHDDMSM